jgi:hypothetical protein
MTARSTVLDTGSVGLGAPFQLTVAPSPKFSP